MDDAFLGSSSSSSSNMSTTYQLLLYALHLARFWLRTGVVACVFLVVPLIVRQQLQHKPPFATPAVDKKSLAAPSSQVDINQRQAHDLPASRAGSWWSRQRKSLPPAPLSLPSRSFSPPSLPREDDSEGTCLSIDAAGAPFCATTPVTPTTPASPLLPPLSPSLARRSTASVVNMVKRLSIHVARGTVSSLIKRWEVVPSAAEGHHHPRQIAPAAVPPSPLASSRVLVAADTSSGSDHDTANSSSDDDAHEPILPHASPNKTIRRVDAMRSVPADKSELTTTTAAATPAPLEPSPTASKRDPASNDADAFGPLLDVLAVQYLALPDTTDDADSSASEHSDGPSPLDDDEDDDHGQDHGLTVPADGARRSRSNSPNCPYAPPPRRPNKNLYGSFDYFRQRYPHSEAGQDGQPSADDLASHPEVSGTVQMVADLEIARRKKRLRRKDVPWSQDEHDATVGPSITVQDAEAEQRRDEDVLEFTYSPEAADPSAYKTLSRVFRNSIHSITTSTDEAEGSTAAETEEDDAAAALTTATATGDDATPPVPPPHRVSYSAWQGTVRSTKSAMSGATSASVMTAASTWTGSSERRPSPSLPSKLMEDLPTDTEMEKGLIVASAMLAAEAIKDSTHDNHASGSHHPASVATQCTHSAPPPAAAAKPYPFMFLQSSNISSLPDNAFKKHSHITVLDLSHNQLIALPPSIAYMQSLTELHLRGNQLAVLPQPMAMLHGLEFLDVGNNALLEIGSWVKSLRKLHHLDVRNNKLRVLPPELGCLDELTSLLVDGNPFEPSFRDLVQPLLLTSASADPAAQPPDVFNFPSLRRDHSDAADDHHSEASSMSSRRRNQLQSQAYRPQRRFSSSGGGGSGGSGGGNSSPEEDYKRHSGASNVSTASSTASSSGYMAQTETGRQRTSSSTHDSGVYSHDDQQHQLTRSLSNGSSHSGLGSPPEPAPVVNKELPFLPLIPPLVPMSPMFQMAHSRQLHEDAEPVDQQQDEDGQSVRPFPERNTSKERSRSRRANRKRSRSAQPRRQRQDSDFHEPLAGDSESATSHDERESSSFTRPPRRQHSLRTNAMTAAATAAASAPSTSPPVPPSLAIAIPPVPALPAHLAALPETKLHRNSPKHAARPPSAALQKLASFLLKPKGNSSDDGTSPTKSPLSSSPSSALSVELALTGDAVYAHRQQFKPNALRSILDYLRDMYDLSPHTSEHDLVSLRIREYGVGTAFDAESGLGGSDVVGPAAASELPTVPPLTPTSSEADRLAKESRRKRIIDEVISTEKTYIRELGLLVELYLHPLEVSHILTAEQIKCLFSNVSSILSFHREYFLPALQQSSDTIGKVFLQHSAYLKMYSVFINNYDKAVSACEKLCRKRKKLRVFFEKCKRHPKHSQLNFASYLILPVQRIPRYRLLLQDLLKCTSPSHPDFTDLMHAMEDITRRANEINEKKREQENYDKVIAIQAKIRSRTLKGGSIVQPHRRLVREGVLRVVRFVQLVETPQSSLGFTLKTLDVGMDFYFFLFNDIMIQCKLVGERYDLWRAFPLSSRLYPASVTSEGLLRVADNTIILYLASSSASLTDWANDINTRHGE
ncbi:hypothetical protein RI367_003284 [Sorochytrium milnesiophthora]